MFGFSLPKLIVLAAIIAAVWYGFKFLGRLEAKRKAEIKAGKKAGGSGEAQNMILCPVCDIYVAAGAASCDRGDCPY
jgi:uncharacterized protein